MTKRDVLKTVKAKCLDCCCGSENEVKLCGAVGCPLYPIRTGKDPNPRKLSPELAQKRAETLRQLREKNKA